jgi:hypothetical protein
MSQASIAEARNLTIARQHPNLCFLSFSITDTLAEIKAALFPDLTQTARVVGRLPGNLDAKFRERIRS